MRLDVRVARTLGWYAVQSALCHLLSLCSDLDLSTTCYAHLACYHSQQLALSLALRSRSILTRRIKLQGPYLATLCLSLRAVGQDTKSLMLFRMIPFSRGRLQRSLKPLIFVGWLTSAESLAIAIAIPLVPFSLIQSTSRTSVVQWHVQTRCTPCSVVEGWLCCWITE